MKAFIASTLILISSSAFAHGPHRDPAKMFEALDSDKSGGVSLQEFLDAPKLRAAKHNHPVPPKDPAKEAEISEKFKAVAGDDQVLNKDEFKTLLEQVRPLHDHHGHQRPGPGADSSDESKPSTEK